MTPDDILSHPSRILTDAQRRSFFRDGYLTLPGWVERSMLGRLQTALGEILELCRERPATDEDFTLAPGHAPATPRLVTARRVHDLHPTFWDYAARSALADLGSDLVGPDVKFREAYINFKRATEGEEVSWHQDFPFFPLTNRAMITTLTYLDDVTPEMGPIEVVPGSHRGAVYDHYDRDGRWSGRLSDADYEQAVRSRALPQAGPAGTVVIFDSCTLHGSAPNTTRRDRPVLVIGFAAADAFPYTATPPSMYSKRTWQIVRGRPASAAHFEAVRCRVPPDWSHNAYIPPDWPEKSNAGIPASRKPPGMM
ncbi:MAG: phytanoyl-CoA dioxygenase family protein [Alphaproteobacteria bacterium]